MVGRQGISKSMGLLLYWHLSSVNIEFRYQYPDATKELIDKKFLKEKRYKLLYANFNE